jgi:hypothetical protein
MAWGAAAGRSHVGMRFAAFQPAHSPPAITPQSIRTSKTCPRPQSFQQAVYDLLRMLLSPRSPGAQPIDTSAACLRITNKTPT